MSDKKKKEAVAKPDKAKNGKKVETASHEAGNEDEELIVQFDGKHSKTGAKLNKPGSGVTLEATKFFVISDDDDDDDDEFDDDDFDDDDFDDDDDDDEYGEFDDDDDDDDDEDDYKSMLDLLAKVGPLFFKKLLATGFETILSQRQRIQKGEIDVWYGEEEPTLDRVRFLDLQSHLENVFKELHNGQASQPPQTLVEFPGGRGDFITYLGAIDSEEVFGVKLSPYIIQPKSPIITAWTLLMSSKTGKPLLLTDASLLTRERTAATTVLAIDRLAKKNATKLAVIGTGRLALDHLRLVDGVRRWEEILVYSPSLKDDRDRLKRMRNELDDYGADMDLKPSKTAAAAIKEADVVMLCTSSGVPVINWRDLAPGALVTSISTNAPMAHEIAPEALPEMNVYCDYRETAPLAAGEMLLAAKAGIWSKDDILGDLPSICAGETKRPRGKRPSFFRSVGLGIEDVAAANALYQSYVAENNAIKETLERFDKAQDDNDDEDGFDFGNFFDDDDD